jgi:predicted NAD/FAD-binding protein
LQALKWRRWQLAEDMTVAHWLQAQRQSDWLVEQFWRPMVLSALNTPLELASMQILATTLRDSLGGSRADSDLLLPRLDLSELFPETALRWLCARGAQWQPGSRVSSIVPSADGVLVDGERFDAAIVAVAPYHAGALLQDGTADAGQGFPLLADIYRISALRRRYQHAVAHAGFAGRHAGLAV